MSALLSTTDLTLRIGDRTLVEGLNLAIQSGESWAVLGPNGTGKTTLLHTLAGLRPAQGGSVYWQGRPLAEVPRRELAQGLGLLLQDDSDPFPASVLETALTGRHPHLGRWGWEGPADLALARQALADTDLLELETRDVATLSGGERRRLTIATLLVQNSQLALLDEPTNHLDLRHQVGLLQTLQTRFTTDGRAQLLVLHDINLALRFCDRLLLLYGDGRWEAGPAVELATVDRLSALYGHVLDAIGSSDRRYFLPG
jgi:iron complex transport system ATP-binding protein